MSVKIKFSGDMGSGKTTLLNILSAFLVTQHAAKLAVNEDDHEFTVREFVLEPKQEEAVHQGDEAINWIEGTHAVLTKGEVETLLALRNGSAKVVSVTEFNQIGTKIPHMPSASALEMVSPMEAYLRRQWDWSERTFGPGFRTAGIIQHITKELREVETAPHDLMEWVDIMILALDGFWRHGGSVERLLMLWQAKQDKNFARNWPDWRTLSENQAIEHDRSKEAA